MLSAKQKAKELIELFEGVPNGNSNYVTDLTAAVYCALKCVDQIMKAIGWDEIEPENKDTYWDDVKLEILKYEERVLNIR
jgi:formiminotetrahydrofolate cyclodeaminase